MMQIPTIQPQAYAPQQPMNPYMQQPMQPSYNAVKIDVHNPQVNAPAAAQAPQYSAPIYNYPQAAPMYSMPQQSLYTPQQAPVNVPEPVITAPSVVSVPQAQAAAVMAQPAPQPQAAPQAAPVNAAPPAVDVKAPEAMSPKIDLNAFISKLTNPDYDTQAATMESIANMTQNDPAKATELLDTRVIDSLLGIMNKDTTKLQGPSPLQLSVREKLMSGATLNEAETKVANAITPMEQAERNKQYALYTTAMLQNLYATEIEKQTKTVVPITELPGAVGVVEQLKKNPDPMVRAAAVDALSYIQRPEYKKDLTTLFNIAQTDQDANVKDIAKKALDKLNQAQ